MSNIMNREDNARLAAESLLKGTGSYPSLTKMNPNQQSDLYTDNRPQMSRIGSTSHSINTQSPHHHSIEFINDEVLSGYRPNGQMSSVRRFFCLFLTFDILFTFLMWLICIMLSGRDIATALEKQVVHYNVHTSMFDVVMASACRFTVLLLFYALLYINHWIVIAFSTSGTCLFLIFKVFVFKWASAEQPVFQVLIVLTSFVLAWGETWFLDFRVIPQETLARTIIVDRQIPNIQNIGATERSPLLGNYINSLPDNYTESIGNFYSPLESPRGSDSEDEDYRRHSSRQFKHVTPKIRSVAMYRSLEKDDTSLSRIRSFLSNPRTQNPSDSTLTHSDLQFKADARENLSIAWSILNCKTGWQKEKASAEGDLVESKFVEKQRKIFRFSGRIKFPPTDFIHELFDEVENMPAWNTTIKKSRRIQLLDKNTDIICQIAAEGGGGVVASREFVILRHWDIKDGYYILAGSSILHPDAPESKKYIRGHSGPNCWALKPITGEENECQFLWLLDTDIKGWVPQYMVESALSGVMLDFVASLRKLSDQKFNNQDSP